MVIKNNDQVEVEGVIYMTKGRNTTYEERIEIVSYCIEHGDDYTAVIEKYGSVTSKSTLG